MKLSIITINYNNAKGLEKTIASILPHLTQEMEYIVVDGLSIDGSVDIIEKASDKITYWVSETDKGIYNAMNKGLRQAKGEYLLFINSGDTINTEASFTEILAQLAENELVYYDLNISDANHGAYFIKKYPEKLDVKYFLEDSLPHTATFIKRDLLKKYGEYNENLKIISDWAFFIDAVCKMQCSYKHVDAVFSTFYTDGISSQVENRNKLWLERAIHIKESYPLMHSLYSEWLDKKRELYKLKHSSSVKLMKKLGFLKWLKY